MCQKENQNSNKTMKRLILLSILNLALVSCQKSEVVSPDDTTQTIYLDCVGSNCLEFIVPGDPYQSNPDFYGYADPSIRKSLNSKTLWVAYSFPHYKMIGSNPVPSVSIHLSKSEDNGTNWSFVKTLFAPDQMNNPADPGVTGFLDHETVNLLPVSDYWLAVRLNYFIPEIGGYSARPGNSFHITVLKADSPENLTTGDKGTIGGSLTHSGWNVNQTLIPPDLTSDAFFWNEPALYYDEANSKLYLIMVAFVFYGPKPVMDKNKTYVYSTSPTGNPSTWNWEYKGILSDASIASELGGERISQPDIAKGQDGKFLLILSPDDWNYEKNDFNHKGCKVVEIISLENPSLERDSQGKLRVRVSITASDANDLGSAASSYDPASNTGILFTKRAKTDTSLTANIWKTGIKP